jgi:hypothetical protein
MLLTWFPVAKLLELVPQIDLALMCGLKVHSLNSCFFLFSIIATTCAFWPLSNLSGLHSRKTVNFSADLESCRLLDNDLPTSPSLLEVIGWKVHS